MGRRIVGVGRGMDYYLGRLHCLHGVAHRGAGKDEELDGVGWGFKARGVHKGPWSTGGRPAINEGCDGHGHGACEGAGSGLLRLNRCVFGGSPFASKATQRQARRQHAEGKGHGCRSHEISAFGAELAPHFFTIGKFSLAYADVDNDS
ncbi:hypothetical protein L7F22_008724 [Adiantum nelumboides]|nr:hypothetical protein [Adiantum nelumboides]